jgi:pilus assembly protein FimV
MTRQPLPLLLALGCCTPISAFALGMGQIQVHSALNQILEADIPLLVANQGELNGLTARLAPASVFAQRGIERLALLSDLMFNIQTGSDGRSVIQVTSKQPVREPLLNFLVQLNGRGQQQIREFAVLLDMPVAVTRQRPALPGSRGQPRAEEPTGGTAAPTITHRGTATYGPVPSGETLWNVAARLRPDASISVPRMMDALLRVNPRAFWKPNVHGLRAGATLRIPSAQEVDPVRFSEQRSQQLASQPPPAVAVATAAPRVPAAAPPAATPAAPRQPRLRLLLPETEGPPAAPSRPPAATGPALAGPFQIKLKNNRPELQLAGLDEARNRLSSLTAPPTGPTEPAPAAPSSPPAPPASPLAVPPPTTVPAPPPVATVAEPPPTRVPPAAQQPPVRLPFQEAAPPGMGGPAPSATLPAPAAGTLPLPVLPPPDSTPSLPSQPPPKPEPLAAVPPPSRLPVAPPATAPVTTTPPAVPAAETGGWLGDIRLWLLGLIAVLIGLLSVVWLRWRGRSEATGAAEPLAIDTALPAEALSEETALMTSRPKRVREGVRPRPSRAVPSPLERADLLIAVGNFEEAEKVVRQARDEQPENAALSAKLLDIHFATRNADAFAKDAEKLSNLLKDETNSLWVKAAQQGRELCPGHELFSGVSRRPLDADLIPTRTVVTSRSPTDSVPAAAKEPISKLPFGGLELELAERTGPVKSTPPTPPPPPVEEKEVTLDTFARLNWQLSDAEPPTVASKPVEGEPLSPLPAENTLARLDSQLPDMEPPTLASTPPVKKAAGLAPRQEEPPLDKGFQFDGVAPPAGKVEPPASLAGADRPSRPAFGKGGAGQRDDELAELFKQFDITPKESGSVSPPVGTRASVSADYVETKLDLALAYLDMDDAVGARSLLEEVLREGNEQQKRRAAEITTKLGGRAG